MGRNIQSHVTSPLPGNRARTVSVDGGGNGTFLEAIEYLIILTDSKQQLQTAKCLLQFAAVTEVSGSEIFQELDFCALRH